MVFHADFQSAARAVESYFHILSGGLFFYLKLALVCGFILASPVWFSQVWRFIAPGLFKHEKKVLIPFVILSTFSFIGGALFAYYVAFPPAFKFLMGFTTDYLTPLPTVKEYFSLSLRLLIAFGVVFELPVLLVFLAKAGMVDVAFLNRNRKYAVLIAFVIAAVVTPTPDIVNQLIMGAPLVILYEISIVAVWLFGRKTFSSFEQQMAEEDQDEAIEPAKDAGKKEDAD